MLNSHNYIHLNALGISTSAHARTHAHTHTHTHSTKKLNGNKL